MLLALEFIKKHWRAAIIVVLALIIAIQTKRLDTLKHEADSQVELKDGELAKIRVEVDRLQTIIRNNKPTNNYKPPESGTDILVKENEAAKKKLVEMDARLAELSKDKGKNASEIAKLLKEREALLGQLIQVQVNYNMWGLCAKIGLGALYAEKIYPEIDLKFLYAWRYSLKVGVTPKFIDVGASRHVDDLVPFFHFQNLEIQGVYGKAFVGGTRWGIGVRSNL